MTRTNKTIAIIGAGNLGASIANGLIDTNTCKAENIILTRRNTKLLSSFKEKGVQVMSNNVEAARQADIILLGLKPYTILEVIAEIEPELVEGKHILVSLATGITIEQIDAAAHHKVPTFRAMPNTAAAVGESLTCICTKNQKNYEEVDTIFNAIGETIQIDEHLMEAATVLGACGIAFVLRFIRGMIQGGIQIGFDAKTANAIVNQTVKGASELLIQRGNHPEHEIDKVTTPRGCTIEGLNEMEHNGFSSALIKGIYSSYKLIEK